MAHIHLAWELGGGLGHAGRLRTLAQALLERGHQVSLSLRDLGHSQRLLDALAVPKFQAPVWLHRTAGMPANQASLAEILIHSGYLDASGLDGLCLGWRALLSTLKPDLLVADYAPTAILAARSLGVPSASVGIGFYSPPAGRPLPNLRPWEQIGHGRLAAAEEHVLRMANSVLAHHHARGFSLACDLLLGDAALLCTWPELDHYGRPPSSATWYGPNFLPRTGTPPYWPQGTGPKVFAYLKREHGQHAALLQALVDAGCRVACYLPEVASGMAPPVMAPNIAYARGPVSLAQAMAEADLCVCHGGEATLVQALLAGVPLLMLPMQLEQFLICQRVDGGGAGINAARLPGPVDWHAVVQRVLGQGSYRAAAAAFGARYAGFSQHDMAVRIAEQFERQLAGP
jgi:hypothetical protein